MEPIPPDRPERPEAALIRRRVHELYWRYDANCATTTLDILSGLHGIELQTQVMQAAVGMHGAGGHRDQCGLVEGGLMLLGILGAARGLDREAIVEICCEYAEAFVGGFGSLLCRELRPEGFSPDNPPHLCEDLTVRAIGFTHDFARSRFG